ncbi:MAG: hypothetical protein IJ849_11905 [Selenomonadaceae bacterium]|nr:hypothetical protein [Selenomonadaceae bacterium]
MKQFTLPLDKAEQRPIVRLKNFHNLDAMLDTGALFPIWVSEEDDLRRVGGILVAQDKPFGGFGGMTTGNLYSIPTFQIGDLIYPNFPILASLHELPCQLLLSATMFSNMIYEVDDQNHSFNVNVPDTESLIRNLRIEDQNGRLHIFCTSE